MQSRSAPQLQHPAVKVKTGAEQARELQERRKELGKKTLAGLQGKQRGYRFGRDGEGQLAITIDPHIFFGKTESCLHRPTRVNWTKPMKVLHAVPTADGGSPLNRIPSPLPVEVVQQETASASQADSGNERAERELEMMQIRFETLRAEFKAAIQKLKNTHEQEMQEFDKQHHREIMLLEETHKQVIERLTEAHSAELCSLESQRENEVAELTSQNEVLKIHIQKMIADHKQQLETQHRELEEAHTQKMQDLEQRLAQQYEREFKERLALHINALVVQHKEELLEMRRVHDDQISSLRRKLTKPALLMQELEHSHKTVAAQRQELAECSHKLAQTAAELRKTQAELSVVSDNLKFYVSCSAEKTQETEEKYRSSMNELLQQNTRIRQTLLVQREELGKTRLQSEMKQREIQMKLCEQMKILVSAKKVVGLVPIPKKATRSQSTPKELP